MQVTIGAGDILKDNFEQNSYNSTHLSLVAQKMSGLCAELMHAVAVTLCAYCASSHWCTSL